MPPGIVNTVLGSGSQVGNPLVSHPAVKKVSFTGSTAVGQAIRKQAGISGETGRNRRRIVSRPAWLAGAAILQLHGNPA